MFVGIFERAVDDARVEVDVGVELARDEVVVLERGLLEALGEVEQRVVDAELGEHAVAGDLDDLRARVEVLVDAVTEAHEQEPGVLVLGLVDVLLEVAAVVVDHLEHLEHLLVGAAVPRAPEREMPALTEVNRLALELPTMRTVDVEQFCSWSAWRMSSRSRMLGSRRRRRTAPWGTPKRVFRKLAV
jgi:hypothetical protein